MVLINGSLQKITAVHNGLLGKQIIKRSHNKDFHEMVWKMAWEIITNHTLIFLLLSFIQLLIIMKLRVNKFIAIYSVMTIVYLSGLFFAIEYNAVIRDCHLSKISGYEESPFKRTPWVSYTWLCKSLPQRYDTFRSVFEDYGIPGSNRDGIANVIAILAALFFALVPASLTFVSRKLIRSSRIRR